MTAWPDPRAWRRTKTLGWKQIRKQADDIISHWDMALPECALIERFLSENFDPRPWQPALCTDEIQCALNRHHSNLLRAQLKNLEDVFLPTFSWPESISIYRRSCLLAAANAMLVECRWLSQIPLATRNALQALPERRWQVLNLLARCPGAHDLCLSNPALAFALANNWCFHRPAVRQPYRAARSLVYKKQRVIAGWLGFPPSNAAVRVLAKIQPNGLSIRRLLFLKEAMEDPATLVLLSHLPTINAGVIELVNSRPLRTRLTHSLLLEVCEAERSDYAHLGPEGSFYSNGLQRLLRTINDVAFMMRDVQGQLRLPDRLKRIADLEVLHEQIAAQFNFNSEKHLKTALEKNLPFPSPPFPGTSDIRPIQTPQELMSEGDQMLHCIGSYLNRARVGSFYAYRVTSPIRATLSIRQNSNLEWVPDESVAFANQRIAKNDRTNLYSALFASAASQNFKPAT